MPNTSGKLTVRAMPTRSWFWGNAREFFGDQLGYSRQCARECGDIARLRFLHVPVYFLFAPSAIEEMFGEKRSAFAKPASFRGPLARRLWGNGLIANRTAQWRQRRHLVHAALGSGDAAESIRITAAVCDRTYASWIASPPEDLYSAFQKLTLDVAVRSLFGANEDAPEKVERALLYLSGAVVSRGQLSWLLDNYAPTRRRRTFLLALRTLDTFLLECISRSLAEEEENGSILTRLARRTAADVGKGEAVSWLRDEAVTLLLASFEAVAIAGFWTVYLLSRHGEVQDTVAQDIQFLGSRVPTTAELARFAGVQNVILESLRLFPPNRSVGRQATKDCSLGGIAIPRGAQVHAFQWIVQRDPHFFPAPDEFRPGRWSDSFRRSLAPYAFFPFGGGDRTCAGRSSALTQLAVMVCRLLQRYRTEVLDVAQPRAENMLRPDRPVRVRLTPA